MNRLSNRMFTLVVVTCVMTFCVAIHGMNHGWLARISQPREVHAEAVNFTPLPRPAGKVKPGWIEVGGVLRPATDVRGNQQQKPQIKKRSDRPKYGLTPSIELASSKPHLRSAAAARREGEQTKRVSLMAGPEETFDARLFREDSRYRKQFLETVVPARVFSPAAPDLDVQRIRAIGRCVHRMLQNDSISLRVMAVPGAPVTFTSFDSGHFMESELACVTVEADNEGVAEANFKAPPGTIGNVNILATSPSTSGRVRFSMRVSLPAEPVEADKAGATKE